MTIGQEVHRVIDHSRASGQRLQRLQSELVPKAESLHAIIPSTQQAANLEGLEVAIGLFSIAPGL